MMKEKKEEMKMVPLLYTGSVGAKYMDLNGNIRRVSVGDPPIDTPEIFVKQRLKERCWIKPKEKDPKKEVKE